MLFKRYEATPTELKADIGQSWNRMGMLLAIILYILATNYYMTGSFVLEEWARNVLTYNMFFLPVSVAILLHTKAYPGHYPARRIAVMMNDFAGLSYGIIAGCVVMLPLYAVILWVTMGNGFRFGRRYLIIATIMAQISLFVIFWLTPYWQADPSMVATLSITALIIPHYGYSLLRENDRALRVAENASLSKSRFLAQASHDLRQPVHAIGLFLETLRRTGLSREQRVIADRIDRSLQGVARLFRSLLDVSTLDSGTLKAEIEPIALGQIFAELEAQNSAAAAWSNVDFRVVKTTKIVRCDRALLTTILQNLISNAIKHSIDGKVVLGCRSEGDRVMIQVCDNGEGIASEHIARVFDEFFQVRERGDPDRQGVGLGLSIVKRISALLGIDVVIDSEHGKGTSIKLQGLELVTDVAPETLRAKRFDPRLPLKGRTVLLVEDDTDVMDAMRDLLTAWGCEVEAHAGLPDQMRVGEYDLLITDFDLGGGVTGEEVVAAVRRQMGGELPVLILTGHDESKVRQMPDQATLTVLKKPIRPAQLRSTISTLLLHSKNAVS